MVDGRGSAIAAQHHMDIPVDILQATEPSRTIRGPLLVAEGREVR
jgi:hypothetical protein